MRRPKNESDMARQGNRNEVDFDKEEATANAEKRQHADSDTKGAVCARAACERVHTKQQRNDDEDCCRVRA
jgi:hypothetical protein